MADTIIAAAERTLPHNLEAERSVLGAILIDNAVWAKAASVIKPTDFYRDAHERIFKAMQRIVDAGGAIDYLLLKEELIKVGDLDEVGGPAYVASLIDGVPKSVNAEYYARVVQEKAILREAIYTANRVLTNAYEAEQDSSIVIEDGVRRLLALSNPQQGGAVRIGDAMKEWLTAFEGEAPPGVKTGLTDLDDILEGGLHFKKLTMIAGRPGMGKTSLLMNLFENIALAGEPAAIFTMEMDPQALVAQTVARQSTIDGHRIRAKALSQKDYGKLSHAMEQIHGMNLYLIEHAKTLTQVQAWCRRLNEEHGVRVFGLDYIQRMGDPQARDRRLEIDYISRGMQRIAVDLDAAMVVLSQLTRDSEKRSDKRPQLSDLKESSGLEQDADVVILIYREDAYNKDPNNPDAGISELIVAKNRTGPVGVARVVFLKEQVRFGNLAQGN